MRCIYTVNADLSSGLCKIPRKGNKGRVNAFGWELLPKHEIESYKIRNGIKYAIPPNSENVQAKLNVGTEPESSCNLSIMLYYFVGVGLPHHPDASSDMILAGYLGATIDAEVQ
ncbi:hypothetical protein WN944_025494 [Citrus x changshan-huyou]|uniref:Uncharacterized protein n=1 Tax=Citrus x changshan-huyou TaxID=2935761 RepID=A0AAP0LUI6_9ROSI